MTKYRVRMSETVFYSFEVEVDDDGLDPEDREEAVAEAAENHFVNSNASITAFTHCEDREVLDFEKV